MERLLPYSKIRVYLLPNLFPFLNPGEGMTKGQRGRRERETQARGETQFRAGDRDRGWHCLKWSPRNTFSAAAED